MQQPITGVQACDICGRPTCTDCQPDAMSECAGEDRIHCHVCAANCAACIQAERDDLHAELAADMRRGH